MIRLAWVFLRTVAKTAAISAPTVLEGACGRLTPQKVDERLQDWSAALLRYADLQVEVQGKEHLEPYSPMVIVSNHQSNYDIPVLFQVLPPSVRMVAKTELYRIPIWGQAMRAAGFIEIDRSDREKAIQSIRVARERIERGVQVWIAPEGTRSRTGELLRFKKGAFLLAEEMGLPVLPITISGTREVLPAGSLRLRMGCRVRVVIHPRVSRSVAPTRDAWIEQVRETIRSGLTADRMNLSRFGGGSGIGDG